MILVDDAIYPFRGRLWCHMVSDQSLDELHACADQLGIPRRAFQDHPVRNHPHYDLPAEARLAALACGAVAVSGRELVERMYRHTERSEVSSQRPGRRVQV